HLPRSPPAPTLFPYTTLFRSTAPTRSSSRTCSHGCSTHVERISSVMLHKGCSSISSTPEFLRVSSCPGPATTSRRKSSRPATRRSEEHTSELQSRFDLVCRLL